MNEVRDGDPEGIPVEYVGVKCQKMYENAELPKFGHPDDACADLIAYTHACLNPGEQHMIHTGIKMAIPKGYEGLVRPRSGLALKNRITITNTPGTIDANYRGEVCVILANESNEVFHVNKGDRIAQIAIREVPTVRFEHVADLEGTDRGEGGFGSTGV